MMRERGPEDDYSFIRSVGKGSYGEVSLAWHRTEGKQYVIKKLSLQNAPRRERKAAEQEAQLLSRLKHPNIVAYKESWEQEDGLLYIVMGFCEGGDLYHKLKEQKGKLLPESQVMDWFIQIAMALQYLHDERIMHRDLKTQNIFLTRSNIIKVGDLGIARVLESQYDMASTLIGTPYYMSPELFSNKPYNYKSDVWALGCCVYEMATLRHAFNAKDMNSLVYRIIEGKLPAMPKDYSPELGELMGAMLSRQPEKRPSVKQILRKPFIKHHIALFLQATKLNHGKRRKKVPDTIPIKDHANTEPQDPLKSASDLPKRQRANKVKSPVKRKTSVASSDIPNTSASPGIPDPHASPAIPDPRASPNIPDPRASPNIPDPRVSPSIPDPRASPAIPDPRAITHVMDQHASSALPQQISLSAIPEISQNCLNHTGVSVATLSNVDINILSTEKNKPRQSHLIPSEEAQRGGFVNETECKMKHCTSHPKDAQETPHSQLIYPVAKRSSKTAHSMEDGDNTMKLVQPVTNDGVIIIQEDLDSTEKLGEPFVPVMESNETSPNPSEDAQIPLCTILQPHNSVSEPSVSRQRRHKNIDEGSADSQKLDRVCSRPLPSPPAIVHRALKTTHSNPEMWRSGTSDCGNQSSTRDALPAQDPRPLSARERRRLKQSQEEIFPAAPAVRRFSAVSVETDGRNLDIIQPCPMNRLSADFVLSERKEPLTRQVSEDELSSSTSSTDKSEGDSKEGRCDTSEMQDLVQLMTQTLHMEKDAGEKQQKPACEFRLHRKYRDTLLLHGKAQEEEPEQKCLQEFHADHLTVPEKFRRMVEALRADVVQGLGVKLLEKVYDDLEEQDESERELRLKRHLGHRYSNFSLKIRQLKFFEENSTF